MEEEYISYPDRLFGLLFNGFLVVVLILAGVWGLWQAAQASIGPVFLLYLLPALLAVAAVPFLLYRALALFGAYYVLKQDGISIRWGLRVEDIPMEFVEWIHPADDLEPQVPLPYFRWPGSVLGKRRVPGGGVVEFMAARMRGMLVIATTQNQAFGISPSDPEHFLSYYQRLVEFGSVSSLPARSVHPSLLITRIWKDSAARLLLLLGFGFSVILLAYVVLSIPAYEQINLGFLTNGEPGDLVPSVRLMLLPVMSWFFYLIDFLAGLFFYRDKESHYLSYLSWGIGMITPLLFLLGSLFILQSG